MSARIQTLEKLVREQSRALVGHVELKRRALNALDPKALDIDEARRLLTAFELPEPEDVGGDGGR